MKEITMSQSTDDLPTLSSAERRALLNRQARLDPRLYPGTRLDELRRLKRADLNELAAAGDPLAAVELSSAAIRSRLDMLEQAVRAAS